MNANAASFGAVPISSVTAVGAPSYTSGTHMWYGTAPSLNAMPETTNTSPNSSSVRLPCPRQRRLARRGRCRASRSRRRSSTCRRAACPTPARRARSTSSPPRSARSTSRCIATIAYSDSDMQLEAEVERHEAARRRSSPSCRAARTASARTSRRGTGRAPRGSRANRTASATRRRSAKNLSRSASMSSTTMPLKRLRRLRAGVGRERDPRATASSASCVSQNATWRRASARNRSTSSTTHAAAQQHDLRQDGSEVDASSWRPSRLQLALRDVREQVGDRCVHHVDERLRLDAHREHEQPRRRPAARTRGG